MQITDLLKEFSEGATAASELAPKLILELLALLATESDGLLTNQLLKELVLRYAGAERELSILNRKLKQKQRQLDADARSAAEIQRALLPGKIQKRPNLDFAWKFQPAELIGGDLFNVISLDRHHLGIYIFDVSGHGVPAAMMSVSVSQALRPASGLVVKEPHSSLPEESNSQQQGSGASSLRPQHVECPGRVMEGLDREFPFTRFEKFFTIFYGVINTVTGEFRYCNAGHPPPLHINTRGAIKQLTEGGTFIGMEGAIPFEEGSLSLAAGDKIILYTDGVLEYENSENEFFGEERFHNTISNLWQQPVTVLLDDFLLALNSFGGDTILQDDITLLGFEFLDQARPST